MDRAIPRRYFWLPTEKEFQTSNPLLTWKWTRHFLASKYGSGEWIMEGEVKSINHHHHDRSKLPPRHNAHMFVGLLLRSPRCRVRW
jgi:hypothetical protein